MSPRARSARSARAALDTRVLEWMKEWSADATRGCEESRFDQLARDLFGHQFEACAIYRRYCETCGATPSDVDHWSQIPAVPAAAFKDLALRSFAEEETLKTFRTSGTTAERRGELHLDTLALYEASLLPTLRHYLFPDGSAPFNIQVLAPSPAEANDSSLSHMFGCAVDALGSARSGFVVRAGTLRVEDLLAELDRASAQGEAVALCGTSFAFVHLLDAMASLGHRCSLPPGSRAMETGGFKGRTREVPREDLYSGLADRLGISPLRMLNQYGMTELGSQFYDSVLRDPDGPRRKLGPPWARVRILDPESGEEMEAGSIGTIAIHDLANTGSVAAIETVDLGRRLTGAADDGFEVLGRTLGAEARGCSIAADALLSGTL